MQKTEGGLHESSIPELWEYLPGNPGVMSWICFWRQKGRGDSPVWDVWGFLSVYFVLGLFGRKTGGLGGCSEGGGKKPPVMVEKDNEKNNKKD